MEVGDPSQGREWLLTCFWDSNRFDDLISLILHPPLAHLSERGPPYRAPRPSSGGFRPILRTLTVDSILERSEISSKDRWAVRPSGCSTGVEFLVNSLE